MGYIRGLVHGAVIGTIAGICIAPQPGKRTREQLSALTTAAREGYGIAQRTVHRVAPLAATAAHMARERMRADSDTDAVTVNGTGRSRTPHE